MRREVPDRVIAPVIGQAPAQHEVVRHVLVRRQQFHRGHAQVGEVLQNGLVGQPGVRPAQLRRDVRVPYGEALDVDLVDDRVREVALLRGVGTPVEGIIGDQAERHVSGGIERAGRVGVVPGVVEHRGPERDLTADRPRVRVEQQLGRVAAQPAGRVVRPVHAEPVGLPGTDPGDEPVPGAAVVVRQPEPGLVAGLPEQAHLGRLGHAGGDREVDAAVARRRTQGRRPPGKCIRHPAYVTDRGGGPIIPPFRPIAGHLPPKGCGQGKPERGHGAAGSSPRCCGSACPGVTMGGRSSPSAAARPARLSGYSRVDTGGDQVSPIRGNGLVGRAGWSGLVTACADWVAVW